MNLFEKFKDLVVVFKLYMLFCKVLIFVIVFVIISEFDVVLRDNCSGLVGYLYCLCLSLWNL